MAMALLDVFMILLTSATMFGGALGSGRPLAESMIPGSADQLVSAVCAGSGLMCVTGADLRQTGGTGVAGASSLRDTSIVTINDLQRDFFVERALVEGGKLSLDENLRDPADRKAFLTSSSANTLPELTSFNTVDIMRALGVAPGSIMATNVATAAFLCGGAALPGEAKACAASMDALGAFVAAELGRNVNVYSTSGAPKSAPIVKAPVTVAKVAKGSLEEGKKIVVCHRMAFPTMLYYCHRVTGTKVVQATLTPESVRNYTPTPIKAVAICHMNTALWLSRHPAFKALHIAHGEEACHFVVENDLVFAPSTAEVVA